MQETYEKVWHQQGCVDPCDCPVFILRKLTGKDGNEITDAMVDISSGQFRYRPGVARQEKVKRALVDWRNVVDGGSQAIPCNDSNKEKLPFNIQLWLEDIVNKDNGFEVSEGERKNS